MREWGCEENCQKDCVKQQWLAEEIKEKNRQIEYLESVNDSLLREVQRLRGVVRELEEEKHSKVANSLK